MDNQTDYKKNHCVSRYIIPFYLNRNKEGELFSDVQWKEDTLDVRYFAKHIERLFSGELCKFYRLREDARGSFGIPGKSDMIYVKEYVKEEAPEDTKGPFPFCLADLSAAVFHTGHGFFFLDIRYENECSFKDIVDVGYFLSNVFTDPPYRPKMEFYYKKSADGEEHNMTDLSDIVCKLLHEHDSERNIELFPTDNRRKPYGYHRLFREKRGKKDEDYQYSLRRGFKSDGIGRGEEERDIEYNASANSKWGIGSSGVVSLTYSEESSEERNRKFLEETYQKNVDVSYFTLYLLALHERELLLKYNLEAVKNWDKQEKLERMRENLIRYNFWFSYNSVSVEAPYQTFYSKLYEIMELESLEHDIQDVVQKVNTYIEDKRKKQDAEHEKGLNRLLAMITFLTIISSVADGWAFADQLPPGKLVLIGRLSVVIVIVAAVIVGLNPKKRIRDFRQKRKAKNGNDKTDETDKIDKTGESTRKSLDISADAK